MADVLTEQYQSEVGIEYFVPLSAIDIQNTMPLCSLFTWVVNRKGLIEFACIYWLTMKDDGLEKTGATIIELKTLSISINLYLLWRKFINEIEWYRLRCVCMFSRQLNADFLVNCFVIEYSKPQFSVRLSFVPFQFLPISIPHPLTLCTPCFSHPPIFRYASVC